LQLLFITSNVLTPELETNPSPNLSDAITPPHLSNPTPSHTHRTVHATDTARRRERGAREWREKERRQKCRERERR